MPSTSIRGGRFCEVDISSLIDVYNGQLHQSVIKETILQRKHSPPVFCRQICINPVLCLCCALRIKAFILLSILQSMFRNVDTTSVMIQRSIRIPTSTDFQTDSHFLNMNEIYWFGLHLLIDSWVIFMGNLVVSTILPAVQGFLRHFLHLRMFFQSKIA